MSQRGIERTAPLLVCTCTTPCAQTGYVRRTGAASIIVLCIGASIILGSFLMVFLAITLLIDTAGNGYSVDFCFKG